MKSPLSSEKFGSAIPAVPAAAPQKKNRSSMVYFTMAKITPSKTPPLLRRLRSR